MKDLDTTRQLKMQYIGTELDRKNRFIRDFLNMIDNQRVTQF